jgi:hypothetical protein
MILGNRYLYGGANPNDQAAAKAAAQELLGASHYYDYFEEINHPIIPTMQTIVDFMGFRVVALPILPISKETLVYGSCDAGKSVMMDNKVSELMSMAAFELHLAAHKVGGKVLFAAGDVEVHRALDGSMFLLDLSRSFPPESVSLVSQFYSDGAVPSSSIFFRMLRPEALKYWKMTGASALSPDAFSAWGREDNIQLNADVSEATKFVLTVKVVDAARDFLQVLNESDSVPSLSTLFHRHGVNMRHLGLVFENVMLLNQNPKVEKRSKEIFAIELVSRLIKNRTRAEMRECTTGSGSDVKKIIAHTANAFLGAYLRHKEAALHYLKEQVLVSYGLSAAKLLFDSKDVLDGVIGSVLAKVCETCGIHLEDTSEQALGSKYVRDICLMHESEIRHFFSTIKKMAVFDVTQSLLQIDHAESCVRQKIFPLAKRLRLIAVKKLNECLSKFPLQKDLDRLVAIQKSLLLDASGPALLGEADLLDLWKIIFDSCLEAGNVVELLEFSAVLEGETGFLGTRIALFLMEFIHKFPRIKTSDSSRFEMLRTIKLIPEIVSSQEFQVGGKGDVCSLEILCLFQWARSALEYLQSNPKHVDVTFAEDARKDAACRLLASSIILDTSRFSFQKDFDDNLKSKLMKMIHTAFHVELDQTELRYISKLCKIPFKFFFPMLLLPSDFNEVLFGGNEAYM